MNDFEQDLRGKLNARADAVLVDDDWDDLMTRMLRRSRNTTRALALALVVVVCAGTVAVAAAARSDHSSDDAAVGPKVKPAGDGVVPTHAKVPTVPGAATGGPTFGGAAAEPSDGSRPAQVLVNGENKGAWISVGIPDQNVPMARVFTRTTGSGITIRAYRADVSQPTSAGPPWWKPAAWCFPNAYARADVSDDAVVDATTTGLYAAEKDGSVVGGSVQLVGRPEQAPRWVVIAQGPANTAQMRATFPGGATDTMAPVDGVAVLVAKAPAGTTDTKVTVTALGASGNELGHATLGGDAASVIGGIYLQAGSVNADPSCFAPQTLPPAGGSQPADAAAARQAVTDAFNSAYKHGVSDDSFAAAFDDSHGFADVMAKLRAGTFKEQVATAQMKFNNLVFLSPTKAAIQYEIDIPNYGTPSFPNRFNEANLIDGTWKLARYGWCNDVSLAGVECPA